MVTRDSDWLQYFAQELLSTFNTALGEVALQPSTGGTFVVEIFYGSDKGDVHVEKAVLWDRKVEGGFPGASCYVSFLFHLPIFRILCVGGIIGSVIRVIFSRILYERDVAASDIHQSILEVS